MADKEKAHLKEMFASLKAIRDQKKAEAQRTGAKKALATEKEKA